MKVLFAASECAPIVKIGGLGDVIASLPRALLKLGIDVRVALPFYAAIKDEALSPLPLLEFDVRYKNQLFPVRVFLVEHPWEKRLKIFLLKNKPFLERGGITAFANTREEVETYAFFSKAVVEMVSHLIHWTLNSPRGEGWFPQIIHCHDWHTGLIPSLIKAHFRIDPHWKDQITLFTIHNLAYQGSSDPELIKNLDETLLQQPLIKWDLADQRLNLILQGVLGSDWVTTVSPSYAEEILTPEYGAGLDEILRARAGRITGILNGIDYQVWNPAQDKFLAAPYDPQEGLESVLGARRKNKNFLQDKLNLPPGEKFFLAAFIGRLDGQQKGLDLILNLIESWDIEELERRKVELVILGTGDPQWEQRLKLAVGKNKFIALELKFDEALAHQIFAGADIILMPSRFEPCGLPQMIGMRYGSLPLVHAVGGLKDSVDSDKDGFVFANYRFESFKSTWETAENLFKNHPSEWRQRMKQALVKDFSWRRSAQQYCDLYAEVLRAKSS